MATTAHPLPGDKITVTPARRWLGSMASGAYLFGPAHRRLLRAARSGDRPRLHREEKRWSRATASALSLTVDVSGLHHINRSVSYVVVPLHEGFADLLALQHLPLDMVYATAEELFAWEHLGPYLRASSQPSVSRTNGPQAYRTLLRAGNAAAARGESLVVFPQGSILGIEIAFTRGAFRTAQRLGMPVLPVVMTGSADVWDYPFSHELRFNARIRMEVLAPIPAHEAVASAETLEREMKGRALAATPGPRRFLPERDGWWDGYRYEIDPHFPELKERVERHREAIKLVSLDRKS